jgi:hypothetical protein
VARRARRRPVAQHDRGAHTPGAALAWAKEVFGDRFGEVTDEDRRRTDELIEQAHQEAERIYGQRAGARHH